MPDREQQRPLGSLLINWDESAMWQGQMKVASNRGADTAALKDLLEKIVDEHAKVQIDSLVHCVWRIYETLTPGFKSAEFREGERVVYHQHVPGFKRFH